MTSDHRGSQPAQLASDVSQQTQLDTGLGLNTALRCYFENWEDSTEVIYSSPDLDYDSGDEKTLQVGRREA